MERENSSFSPKDSISCGLRSRSLFLLGMQKKPTLSAQPGPTVMSGDNAALFCHSESPNDGYTLCKEGEAHGCWHSHVLSRPSDPGHFAVTDEEPRA